MKRIALCLILSLALMTSPVMAEETKEAFTELEDAAQYQEEIEAFKEEIEEYKEEIEKYQEELEHYAEQQEIVTELNRSELDGLGRIEGPIYVSGHKSPDTDTVGSSIAYAELLRQLGYDAQAVVFGEINKETKLILEKAGVEEPMKMEDASPPKSSPFESAFATLSEMTQTLSPSRNSFSEKGRPLVKLNS